MTLRARLMVAAGACLVVVVAAFFALERRQAQVLFAQLDTQLTLLADRAVAMSSSPGSAQQSELAADTGEFYIGVAFDGGLSTIVAPASMPDLVPDLLDIRNTSGEEPVTIGSSVGEDVRVVVRNLDAGVLVIGQPTGPIDDAIGNLRVSALVAIVAIGVFALLVGSWVDRLSIQPITAATEVARAITDGRRDERVPATPGNTEAATLGSAINLMLDNTAETEARLRSFVADASHELRTPLTTLMGYADLHRQGLLAAPGGVDDAMRRIQGEARRMSTIVEHLFLLANLDESTMPIGRTTVDVGQLLDDVVADARVVQPDRLITADVPAVVEVSADPERLLQAVAVLVSNALTHTPASARLALEARTVGDRVDIEVSDEGPGIAPEHLSRLFDRFYRVDSARDRQHGGSGLGLSIARSIAEAHGGTLTVESALGHGSTFTLCVPVV